MEFLPDPLPGALGGTLADAGVGGEVDQGFREGSGVGVGDKDTGGGELAPEVGARGGQGGEAGSHRFEDREAEVLLRGGQDEQISVGEGVELGLPADQAEEAHAVGRADVLGEIVEPLGVSGLAVTGHLQIDRGRIRNSRDRFEQVMKALYRVQATQEQDTGRTPLRGPWVVPGWLMKELEVFGGFEGERQDTDRSRTGPPAGLIPLGIGGAVHHTIAEECAAEESEIETLLEELVRDGPVVEHAVTGQDSGPAQASGQPKRAAVCRLPDAVEVEY